MLDIGTAFWRTGGAGPAAEHGVGASQYRHSLGTVRYKRFTVY
jgi:hypothetical protein